MGLQVIGTGIARTGTESLKTALEILGFGKCYHMFELIKDPGRLVYWRELMAQNKTDFARLFQGYQSAVDFPSSIYYREFLQEYPDAKLILTIRDADEWYDSASETIFYEMSLTMMRIVKFLGIFFTSFRNYRNLFEFHVEIHHTRFFQGKIRDREACKKIYNEWNEKVIQNLPADKLLVFEVKDGWEPLCKLLQVPVPDVPFPKKNGREKFFHNITQSVSLPINIKKLALKK
jgi:hypothetical protein